MSYFKDLFHRLRGSLGWVAAQYVLTLVLVLLVLAWTRLPDKHVWQVLLTLLVPLLLAISALELEAGTMRALADDDGRRVKLVFGAMALLVWVALFWACWAVLDWCDDRIRAVGRVSELARLGRGASDGLYLRSSSEMDDCGGVGAALDHRSGKDYPVCDGFGAVGLADAVSQDHSSVAELAVVAGGGGGGAGERCAAGAISLPVFRMERSRTRSGRWC